jgi:4-amino-4-deoxy-L-arabinose transferase-like glycosyltransferase
MPPNTQYVLRNTQYSLASRITSHSALAIICLLAFLLRVWCLDCYGLWYDEVASIQIASRGPLAILTDRFGGMLVQTPLHYLMVWLTALPVDATTTSVLVRLPSVIVGALTPLVVYGISREIFGRAQGLLAALLIALSAVHISHSQDVRPYTMLIFTTALSVYTLLRAERERSRKWWLAFGLSTVVALYVSYFSLTLFMPALVPYLGWRIYRLWGRKKTEVFGVRYPLLAVSAIAVAAIHVLLDVLRVQRNPPNVNVLLETPRLLLDQGVLLLRSTFQLGLGGVGEIYAQWGLFLLALLGAYAAVRQRRTGALALCVSLIIIPSILLSIAKTTNPVFQRYAIFIMPFYLLLIAHGAMLGGQWLLALGHWVVRSLKRTTDGTYASRITHHVSRSALVAAPVALLFLIGVYIYFSPEGHRRFSYLPDYRGVARYLSSVAGPRDLIIMADEPALGAEVVNFYWEGMSPAPTFDARDPRLFSQNPKGTIFWVVSFFQNNPEFIRDLPSSDPEWTDPTYFERIVIVRDARHSILPGMTDLAEQAQKKLDALQMPAFQPVRTLDGLLHQARGETAQAADSYRQAGTYFPLLGAEFFSSARGFGERGEHDKAWREAITSNFMQPGNPDLHAWMSQELADAGYFAESRVEAEIAEALRK